MPVIHTHVSVPTTQEQRDTLKNLFGQAITAVPGKTENWLMCLFEDNVPMYFGGSDDAPVAYVEVNVFGTSVPKSAWEKLTPQIMDALQDSAERARRPHLHPLHRHRRLGLERRQFLISAPSA